LTLENYDNTNDSNRDALRAIKSKREDTYKRLIKDAPKPLINVEKRFTGMSDESVVALARSFDVKALEYILIKYKNFVRAKARSYFLIGADHDDIIQEGMIGLYKSIRDFKADKQSSFRAFAELCITRQIITAIKSATRQKHQPLNSYISLNRPVYDEDSDRTLLDIIQGARELNPEEIVIDREEFDLIEQKISKILSRLEMQVLNAYVDGKSYTEIAHEIGKDVKSVDNALQRIKTKMEKHQSL